MQRALEARSGSRATTSRLVSTYFDTSTRDLARSGLTLRVREDANGFTQTVKSGRLAQSGDVSVFARGEWEDPIRTAAPDPAAPHSGHLIDPALVGRLLPVFRTVVERRKIDLHPMPETHIEAAVDRGRIQAIVRDTIEPISEIELELKGGSPVALYDLALDLMKVAPLHLDLRSKAERGYLLASNETTPIEPAHSASLDLDPSLSGDEALRRIGCACLMQVIRNEPAVLAGIGEGIHQMRVAVRRLRAILSAFSTYLPEDERRVVSDELRWLADALGAARNLDAFESALLAPAHDALGDANGIDALTAVTESRRRAAFVKAGRAVRSTRYTRLLLTQFRWFEGCLWRHGDITTGLEEPIGDVAEHVLGRRRRVAKRRGKHFAAQSGSERHRLRIALKKLRYASELLSALYEPDNVGRFTKRLKKLQNHLGDVNDVRVAHDIVDELAKPTQPDSPAIMNAGEALIGWHEQRLAKREPKLRTELRQLLEAEPFWTES